MAVFLPKPMRFSTKRQVLATHCPSGRDFLEIWHESVGGFGVRVMAPSKDGWVRRTYICRFDERVPDGKGGFREKNRKVSLGLVEPIGDEPSITFDHALEQVLAKRRVLREQKASDSTPRMTVGEAWSHYASEKQLNRPATLDKDTGTYERHLKHLEGRLLDELSYRFWTDTLEQLKAGKLVVGKVMKDGVPVDDTRGPLAASSLLAVLNVASNLYEIAHKHKGLKGFAPRENPAKETKRLVGVPAKRKTSIPLKDFAVAWQASDQLIAPWWRDMLRVCVLTGLRRSLLFSLRFDEIDWQQGTLLIDPRKRGTKRRGKSIEERPEPMQLPLSSQVLGILRERRRFAPDDKGAVWFAPPGTRGKTGVLTEPRSAWSAVEKRIGRHFTPHDLRRTFATLGMVATDKGSVLSVALLMLHSGSTLAKAVGLPDITVEYMNTDEAQSMMRQATQAISDYAMRLVEQGTQDADPELPHELEAALKEE